MTASPGVFGFSMAVLLLAAFALPAPAASSFSIPISGYGLFEGWVGGTSMGGDVKSAIGVSKVGTASPLVDIHIAVFLIVIPTEEAVSNSRSGANIKGISAITPTLDYNKTCMVTGYHSCATPNGVFLEYTDFPAY